MWKQPKCPLTEEWIDKIWHIYTMEYYSAIKRGGGIGSFAETWMDLEIVILSEVRQRRRKSVWHPFYAGSKKEIVQMNLFIKQKQTHRLRGWIYGGQWGRTGEGTVSKFGTNRYTRLYLKWITNKVLLYSRRNTAQCYVEARMRGEFGGEQIHAYAWLSPFAVHLKLSQHC